MLCKKNLKWTKLKKMTTECVVIGHPIVEVASAVATSSGTMRFHGF